MAIHPIRDGASSLGLSGRFDKWFFLNFILEIISNLKKKLQKLKYHEDHPIPFS